MDENRIIERMVKTLRSRPGEWLTFAYLSSLVALPDCNGDLIGAMADFRPDLFAVTKDKKLKLRMKVVEDVAQQGPRNWQVPVPPEKVSELNHASRMGTSSRDLRDRCYCNLPDEEILADLKEDSIPDEALVYSCCWKNICRVRGKSFHLVPHETWTEICRRRGYIQRRENPRGF